jgi:limonene-1,2-epoxide hydrolase
MQTKISAVEAYLEALEKKNLMEAPLADRVRYQNPLTGEAIEGKHNVIRFLHSNMLPSQQGIRVIRHIVEGDYIATMWEAEMTFGVLTIFQLFRVEDGQITELRAFYDPREYLENAGRQRRNPEQKSSEGI